MSIRSRIGIPGGTCEFDLPGYYAWQHLDPAEERRPTWSAGPARWRRWPNPSTCC
jgi:cell division FtsZ-interacting protein ZapD